MLLRNGDPACHSPVRGTGNTINSIPRHRGCKLPTASSRSFSVFAKTLLYFEPQHQKSGSPLHISHLLFLAPYNLLLHMQQKVGEALAHTGERMVGLA
jgi:hypothetical protein